MYLSRELTDSSLPKIGKEFGGRDHTTVIHATSKIARLIREDRSVYNLVQELTARIKQVALSAGTRLCATAQLASPVRVPQRRHAAQSRAQAVFPVVHTPYYYYESF